MSKKHEIVNIDFVIEIKRNCFVNAIEIIENATAALFAYTKSLLSFLILIFINTSYVKEEKGDNQCQDQEQKN